MTGMGKNGDRSGPGRESLPGKATNRLGPPPGPALILSKAADSGNIPASITGPLPSPREGEAPAEPGRHLDAMKRPGGWGLEDETPRVRPSRRGLEDETPATRPVSRA